LACLQVKKEANVLTLNKVR